jgi:metallo-beta-lactamase class B
MAEWGGTGFNFTVTPERPRDYWFKSYIGSAQKFRDAARQAGADGMIANHPRLDGSNRKFPLLAARKPGDPHPYVTGTEGVLRYLTIAEECAKAGLIDLEIKK